MIINQYYNLGDRFKDSEIARVACQPKKKGAVSKLSSHFSLLKDHKNENSNDYCKTVVAAKEELVATLEQGKDTPFENYKLCEMESCGEDVCGDCKIKFYHNSIDEHYHFEQNIDINDNSKVNRSLV